MLSAYKEKLYGEIMRFYFPSKPSLPSDAYFPCPAIVMPTAVGRSMSVRTKERLIVLFGFCFLVGSFFRLFFFGGLLSAEVLSCFSG